MGEVISEAGNYDLIVLDESVSTYGYGMFGQTDLVKYMDIIWSYQDYSEVELDYPGKYTTNDEGYTIFRPKTEAAFSMLADYKN